ncbi:MAG TPA: family 16 glycoside hydrolase [Pseudomonadales bacterium]|nr:family 16 glycoside hydrolase [Pseudomonadales bacterium]
MKLIRAFVFCFCVALVLPAMGAQININFGSGEYKGLTNDFRGALFGGGRPGDWQIIMDEVPSAFSPISSNAAPRINHISVLAQTDTDPIDERFPMLIYDKETFKNFQVKTQFKIIGGAMEQMAGMVFRFQNESNFYVVRVSALGHNLRFYKVVNGVRGNPIGPTLDVSLGAWHSLTIQCQGNQIMCWLDDNLAMPALQDSTFTEGKIGFWTKSDSLTHFGDTRITYTPVVPMAQVLIQNILKQQPRILGLRIYTPDKNGVARIIASKIPDEVGMAGGQAEQGALEKGATFFGRGKGTCAVTMPLEDRNGDPIAAVRVQWKTFPGETEDTAVTRARTLVQSMQAQVLSSQDLLQ